MDRREFVGRGGWIAVAGGAGLALPGLPRSALAAHSDLNRELRALQRQIHGLVVTPTSPHYLNAKRDYLTRFDGICPRAIVYVQTVEDVQKTVHWARRHGVRIVARSGGHSYGGYSIVRDGVVIDVSRLQRIQLHANGTASVGSGAVLIDVYTELWKGGRVIPAGSCATVGIGGHALGGGVGYLTRKFGLTTDNIRRVTMVTAAGEVVVADENHHDDLLWASRGGGGGNFGIVTDFLFQTHPVAGVTTFSISWPWPAAAQVVSAWQEFAPFAPDELFSVCLPIASPGTNPPDMLVFGMYDGPQAELQTVLAPFIEAAGEPSSVPPAHLGTPERASPFGSGPSYTQRTWLEAAMFYAGCSTMTFGECHLIGKTPLGQLQRDTNKGKSSYAVKPLPAQAIQTMLSAVEAVLNEPGLSVGGIILDSYGGAVARIPKHATAFLHRDALYSMQYFAGWEREAARSTVIANLKWIDNFYAAMRPYVSGAYVNYIDPALRNSLPLYYGSNLPRLVSVKRKYDPHDVFRFPQSIPTRLR